MNAFWKICSVFSFLFFSCTETEKEITVPPDVIGKEKMALILADIHVAEAKHTVLNFSESLLISVSELDSILALHQHTREQYEKSIAFYIEEHKLLNEIYGQTINELSKKNLPSSSMERR